MAGNLYRAIQRTGGLQPVINAMNDIYEKKKMAEYYEGLNKEVNTMMTKMNEYKDPNYGKNDGMVTPQQAGIVNPAIGQLMNVAKQSQDMYSQSNNIANTNIENPQYAQQDQAVNQLFNAPQKIASLESPAMSKAEKYNQANNMANEFMMNQITNPNADLQKAGGIYNLFNKQANQFASKGISEYDPNKKYVDNDTGKTIQEAREKETPDKFVDVNEKDSKPFQIAGNWFVKKIKINQKTGESLKDANGDVVYELQKVGDGDNGNSGGSGSGSGGRGENSDVKPNWTEIANAREAAGKLKLEYDFYNNLYKLPKNKNGKYDTGRVDKDGNKILVSGGEIEEEKQKIMRQMEIAQEKSTLLQEEVNYGATAFYNKIYSTLESEELAKRGVDKKDPNVIEKIINAEIAELAKLPQYKKNPHALDLFKDIATKQVKQRYFQNTKL
jgi:hypothetical protein